MLGGINACTHLSCCLWTYYLISTILVIFDRLECLTIFFSLFRFKEKTLFQVEGDDRESEEIDGGDFYKVSR